MKGKRPLLILAIIIVALVLTLRFFPRTTEAQKAFLEKADLLKENVVTEEMIEALGRSPVVGLGHVVFLSTSEGDARAQVYTGTGKTLAEAWDSAARKASKAAKGAPRWLRADVVTSGWPDTTVMVNKGMRNDAAGFHFNGIALDTRFRTALTEGELNGWGIYDYKDGSLSLKRLNDWLEDHGKKPLEKLPKLLMNFLSRGWFCDENNEVYPLYYEGADASRRMVSEIDADYIKNIIDTASSYLADQVKEDGTFVYNIRPQFDKESEDYNILRHSGTVWSLIIRYRMFHDEALKEKIERTIDYLLTQILYDDDGAGYVYEAKSNEIKLGGNGIAIVTLTEYMDLFEDERYREVCEALGEGILKQQDPETGSYWHILDSNFEKAEEFRTIYYDGECTFGLARLYSLTGEQKWLDAACKAIDHFIAEDYTQYRDHWVAYSLNEVTKYVDRQDYFDFALANATNNFERIRGRYRTYPTNLELLISSFETWQRMVEKGVDTGDFDVQDLLDVIAARANRQLSGYFYPEQAMYMQNPRRILGSFMMRNEKFRVRIDDVQHNIGGFYLYWKNYDAMMAAGLNSGILDESLDWE